MMAVNEIERLRRSRAELQSRIQLYPSGSNQITQTLDEARDLLAKVAEIDHRLSMVDVEREAERDRREQEMLKANQLMAIATKGASRAAWAAAAAAASCVLALAALLGR